MINWRAVLALVLGVPGAAFAWTYSPLTTVSELTQPRMFQHLESSGNRSIAISESIVAVTWEDNRSGQPAAYIAFKTQGAAQFTPATRLSETGPAYEPALAGLPDGRFIVVWEASDHVWGRVVNTEQLGPVRQLSSAPAREATITTSKAGQIWLAWAEKAGPHYRIVSSTASLKADRIQLSDARPVDPAPPKQDQLYPSIALTRDGTIISWEDRRYGHTRLFTAHAAHGEAFTPLRQLNQLKAKRSATFGMGTGAMRTVLASDGQSRIFSCWLDKRDFAEGYDVYAAFSQDAGKTFGQNLKVEDLLGANQAQWHAVSAMDNQGHSVVAWDDKRDGSPDIWMSWFMANGWSDDDSPSGTNGKGSQSHPAMVFDNQGRLHMAFLDREPGKTAIRYLVATPSPDQFGQTP